jgi:hypothetical protein
MIEAHPYENLRPSQMTPAGKLNFDSTQKGVEAENQRRGLPVRPYMNKSKPAPFLPRANRTIQRNLTGTGSGLFFSQYCQHLRGTDSLEREDIFSFHFGSFKSFQRQIARQVARC